MCIFIWATLRVDCGKASVNVGWLHEVNKLKDSSQFGPDRKHLPISEKVQVCQMASPELWILPITQPRRVDIHINEHTVECGVNFPRKALGNGEGGLSLKASQK